ncbi:MAG: endonuclease V [Candidatus Methanosuratus sp.]|nr:endonuclease V [Candidatus Methanosuratincola sp.]
MNAQRLLARKVSFSPPGEVSSVCGMDIAYRGEEGFAAGVVLRYPGLDEVEVSTDTGMALVPYMPYFLAFREMRFLVPLFRKLRTRASVYMVNGHGTFHPEGLGAASHFGIAFDIPTIGVCLSPLSFSGGSVEGDRLVADGREVGAVIRTRSGRKVFVSVGHRMSPRLAEEVARACMRGHRLPEPLFLADLYSKRAMEGRP